MLSRGRRIALGATSVFFIAAGVLHFLLPDAYLKVMPPYIPWPRQMVYLSGAAEIAGGLGLIVRSWRRAAAWGLVLLLIVVFPANVYMAEHSVKAQGWLWARLPLQGLLMWWVVWCGRSQSSFFSKRLAASRRMVTP